MNRDMRILRRNVELSRERLELFRLPDGVIGAKWRGLVFPLHGHDAIDIEDRGFPPGQCDAWTEPTGRWTLSKGPEGADAYLFLEGSAETCNRTIRALEKQRITVVRSGPNLSGGVGDWFIRISTPSDEAISAVNKILDETTLVRDAEDDSTVRERLLADALLKAKAAQAELRSELDRAKAAAANLPGETEQRQALQESLLAMSARLAEVEAEAEGLRARLEAQPRTAGKPNGLEAELAVAAAGLLPRLAFLGSSMSFVAVELPSRSQLWKALAGLDRQERGQPEGWKSLSGHPGWWERHFSTGQDNQGRLYARLSGTPARWQVLVSHKQDQASDLRRISRL
jgi:hypothetical protein